METNSVHFFTLFRSLIFFKVRNIDCQMNGCSSTFLSRCLAYYCVLVDSTSTFFLQKVLPWRVLCILPAQLKFHVPWEGFPSSSSPVSIDIVCTFISTLIMMCWSVFLFACTLLGIWNKLFCGPSAFHRAWHTVGDQQLYVGWMLRVEETDYPKG